MSSKFGKSIVGVATILFLISCNAQAGLTDGLVAYYKLDGTSGAVVDETGNNDGVNLGATRGVAGKVGNAFEFDGNPWSEYVTITDNDTLDITGAITLSAWVNSETISDYQKILNKQGGPDTPYYFDIRSSHFRGCVNVGGSRKTLESDTTLSSNVWYLLVFTYDGSISRLYINGTEDKNSGTAWSGAISTNTRNINIGVEGDYNSAPFDGKIDEVRIYNRALSAPEVQELYQEETLIDDFSDGDYTNDFQWVVCNGGFTVEGGKLKESAKGDNYSASIYTLVDRNITSVQIDFVNPPQGGRGEHNMSFCLTDTIGADGIDFNGVPGDYLPVNGYMVILYWDSANWGTPNDYMRVLRIDNGIRSPYIDSGAIIPIIRDSLPHTVKLSIENGVVKTEIDGVIANIANDSTYTEFRGFTINSYMKYYSIDAQFDNVKVYTNGGGNSDDWSFVHITDTHIGKFCGLAKAEERLAAAITEIKKKAQKPDFILVTGDIVENAGVIKDVLGIPLYIPVPYYQRFLSAFKSLPSDIKVYTVPGNHDRYVYWSIIDCLPSPIIMPDPLTLYEDKIGLPGNATPLGIPNNYSFFHKELLFVGLDSGADVEHISDYEHSKGLSPEQWSALIDPTKIDPDAPKVIFMHHPAMHVDNNNEYGISEYQEDFIDYSVNNNVQMVLTGHTHQKHILNEYGQGVPPNSTEYPQFIQTPSTGRTDNDSPAYRVIDVVGVSARPQEVTPIQLKKHNLITGVIHSPANLHICDSHGRHVGVINPNEIERGIPGSFYFGHHIIDTDDGNVVLPEKILIFDPNDNYLYKVVGSEVGTYRLALTSTEDGNEITFDANDIPTLPDSVHKYTIDWDLLAQGGEGVIVEIDNDGDGVFEKTITSDDYLAGEEVNAPPAANAGGPYVAQATSWSGASITLDGTGSTDPDGDAIAYTWDLDLSVDSDSDGDLTNDVDSTDDTLTRVFPIGQTEISLVVTDEYGLSSDPDVTTVTVSFIKVNIDIKPGSSPNRINMGSHGVIPVAFLTDEGFDASTIDPSTVTLRGEDFADGMVKLRGKKDAQVPMANLEDIDDDGDLDLVVHLETEKLTEHSLEAICQLGALTYDGFVVSGSDFIEIVPTE